MSEPLYKGKNKAINLQLTKSVELLQKLQQIVSPLDLAREVGGIKAYFHYKKQIIKKDLESKDLFNIQSFEDAEKQKNPGGIITEENDEGLESHDLSESSSLLELEEYTPKPRSKTRRMTLKESTLLSDSEKMNMVARHKTEVKGYWHEKRLFWIIREFFFRKELATTWRRSYDTVYVPK